MSATVTQITPNGTYYANECINITIESPANTATVQKTTVFRLMLLRGDLETYKSQELILGQGQTIKIDLNKWAKDLLYHTVPTGNSIDNDTAFGFVGVETKVNEYNLTTCVLTEGTYVTDIDPVSRNLGILSAYAQPDKQGSLVTTNNADFDTFRDVYLCEGGFSYLNLYRKTSATITINAVLENGSTSVINLGGVVGWKVYKIQRGVNDIPATTRSATVVLTGDKRLTFHFCGCTCKDDDASILFLEKMGAWTVFDFEKIGLVRAGQSGQLLKIDNDCRDLQYGGNTFGFQEGALTNVYRSKIGVRKENIIGLSMIAAATKVMQLDGSDWIKLEYAPSQIQIFEADNILNLEVQAGYSIEGQRVEK